MNRNNKRIIAAVEDLFFTVKISDSAKRAGMEVTFVKTEKDLIDKAKEDQPVLIIIDLNASSLKPVALISKLKGSSDLKGINTLAFVSHVQGDLKQKALDAGCNMVLARSAFSTNLPQILKRHSTSL